MDLLATYSSSSSGSEAPVDGAAAERERGLTPQGSREPSPKRLKGIASRLPDPSALLQPRHAVAASAPAPPAQRVRAFPHVDGQFAAHVTLAAPAPPDVARALRAALPRLRAALPVLCALDPAEGHVSLSHTVPIAGSQLDSLLRMLVDAARRVDPFDLVLHRLACLANDDASLAFLAVEGAGTCAAFTRAVRAVDAAFRRHGLPAFYAEPRPHVSVAWLPGGALDRVECALERHPSQLPPWRIKATELVCRIGQRTHALRLGGGER